VAKSETYSGSSSASGLITSNEEPNHYYPGSFFLLDLLDIILFRLLEDLRMFLSCFTYRAAFMCGREPNFELTEEEKQELRQYNWEEFLAMTRSAINNKSKLKLISVNYVLAQRSSAMLISIASVL
ncbi:hypothetical protein BHE74_00026657, partial [Ensete ventricosum]